MCHTAELMLQLWCWNSGHLFYISAALSRDPSSILLLCCFDLRFLVLGITRWLCLFIQDVFVMPGLQTIWHPRLFLEVHFLNGFG